MGLSSPRLTIDPDMEAMLTIAPRPCSSIARPSAWHDRNTPVTLMSITRCHMAQGHLLGRRGVGDSCAVDRQAERAEFALGVPHRIGEDVGIHDIARYCDRTLTRHDDLVADLFQG